MVDVCGGEGPVCAKTKVSKAVVCAKMWRWMAETTARESDGKKVFHGLGVVRHVIRSISVVQLPSYIRCWRSRRC